MAIVALQHAVQAALDMQHQPWLHAEANVNRPACNTYQDQVTWLCGFNLPPGVSLLLPNNTLYVVIVTAAGVALVNLNVQVKAFAHEKLVQSPTVNTLTVAAKLLKRQSYVILQHAKSLKHHSAGQILIIGTKKTG